MSRSRLARNAGGSSIQRPLSGINQAAKSNQKNRKSPPNCPPCPPPQAPPCAEQPATTSTSANPKPSPVPFHSNPRRHLRPLIRPHQPKNPPPTVPLKVHQLVIQKTQALETRTPSHGRLLPQDDESQGGVEPG
jgi:hypothetical protein